ncbi:hypothetical protein GCM10029978_067060 [Actinoallomurus acanthiterrae]
MSREVRRVPLDFGWPLKTIWDGYLRPDNLALPGCHSCNGWGTNASSNWLAEIVWLLARVGDAAARPGQPLPDLLHMLGPGTPPGPDMAELTGGLAGRPSDIIFGHDACDHWSMTRKIIKAAGLDPDTWGKCSTCDGHGNLGTPEQRAAFEAWTPTPPLAGEGWQLWETVTEGSPLTPVFATEEQLARHLCNNLGYNPTAARTLIEEGYTIGSFVATGRSVLDSDNDADVIAALADPDKVFTEEDRAAAEIEHHLDSDR